jgi:hypothetical protein
VGIRNGIRIIVYAPGGISGTLGRIACAQSAMLEPRPQYLRGKGYGNEVVLSLEMAGFDQQPVYCTRFILLLVFWGTVGNSK